MRVNLSSRSTPILVALAKAYIDLTDAEKVSVRLAGRLLVMVLTLSLASVIRICFRHLGRYLRQMQLLRKCLNFARPHLQDGCPLAQCEERFRLGSYAFYQLHCTETWASVYS